jgi:hypothetical protein
MKAIQARAERDLLDALERLKTGSPKNSELAKKARLGKLRINPSTVAQEAGCSRTLIGHESCAYPEIRNQILKYRHDAAKPATSFEEINRHLRRENHVLNEAVRVAMSRVAAMELQLQAGETVAMRKVRELQRQLAKALESPNVPNASNVSHISTSRKRP